MPGSADAITPAIAEMLARSGCRYIDLGVESFDDRILEYIKKGITADRIRQAIHNLADAGIQVKLNVLIGSSPLETTTTVGHTLREVRRLPVDQIMIKYRVTFSRNRISPPVHGKRMD